MSGLPRISGRECAKALEKAGFYLKRQESSHMILRRDEPFGQVVVPAIIRQAGLGIEEFIKLL